MLSRCYLFFFLLRKKVEGPRPPQPSSIAGPEYLLYIIFPKYGFILLFLFYLPRRIFFEATFCKQQVLKRLQATNIRYSVLNFGPT